jgi:hypothetical protein
MNKMRRSVFPVVASVFVAACGPAPENSRPAERPGARPGAEQGYVAPPAVTGAQRAAGGRVLLTGHAAPAVKVRLASPAGATMFAMTDHAGRWRLLLPAAQDVRLYGLSAPGQGRPIQAEGYIAVTPSGLAAQLRAGSGAVVLGARASGVSLLAADFDRKGVVALSGVAPPGAPVTIAVDTAPRGSTRTGEGGRFMLALNEPLKPGDHVLTLTGAGGSGTQARVTIAPAAPLSGGPFRVELAPGGWRIDWLTPGGGVQSTLLFDRAASPS